MGESNREPRQGRKGLAHFWTFCGTRAVVGEKASALARGINSSPRTRGVNRRKLVSALKTWGKEPRFPMRGHVRG